MHFARNQTQLTIFTPAHRSFTSGTILGATTMRQTSQLRRPRLEELETRLTPASFLELNTVLAPLTNAVVTVAAAVPPTSGGELLQFQFTITQSSGSTSQPSVANRIAEPAGHDSAMNDAADATVIVVNSFRPFVLRLVSLVPAETNFAATVPSLPSDAGRTFASATDGVPIPTIRNQLNGAGVDPVTSATIPATASSIVALTPTETAARLLAAAASAGATSSYQISGLDEAAPLTPRVPPVRFDEIISTPATPQRVPTSGGDSTVTTPNDLVRPIPQSGDGSTAQPPQAKPDQPTTVWTWVERAIAGSLIAGTAFYVFVMGHANSLARKWRDRRRQNLDWVDERR
jgi:hypothetical protein